MDESYLTIDISYVAYLNPNNTSHIPMDRIFVEQITDDTHSIAVIDKHRIFSAENPGQLATVFECSLTNPTVEDNAQIFYAMAPSIGADNVFADLKEPHRSCKLNSWSIVTKDRDINNLFQAVEPLKHSDRVDLYSTRHSITPEETVTSTSKSLFSLVAFSEKQNWKTGILQRCIDALVLPQYKSNAEVYSVIDEEYRKLLRFKYEIEYEGTPDIPNGVLVSFIRRVVSILGLQHSHDTTTFHEIPDSIDSYLDFFKKTIPFYKMEGSRKDRLSNILTLWSGAKIIEITDGGYKLEIEQNVLQGLSYMAPLLQRPKTLTILETPM